MKIFKRTRRAENATLTEIGLLLFIAQNTDASRLYQYPDSETAEAVDSTKTTVNRWRNRLIANGYLTVRIPRKWLGEKGWSEVGVEISHKGFNALLVNSKMGQATTLTQNTMDPDPFGSITIYSELPVKKEIVSRTDSCTMGINADGSGSLIDRTVRLVLDGIEHRRDMATLAASHWAVIRPRLLKGGDIIGTNDVDGDGYILKHLLPKCACGNVVKYSHQMLGGDRVQVFLKSACDECTAAEVQRTRTVTEKEFDRLLKQGWVKFIHDGDKVPVDYYTRDGELRLKYLRELALDRCECGQPVFYELVKSDSGVHVNAGQQCSTCWSLQRATAGVMKSPVLDNPPTTTEAETGSNVQ
jgi:hypothetical protein